MMRTSNIMAAAALVFILWSADALAANAVVTAPANVHAARNGNSAVIGTVRPMAAIDATNCRNGWCAAAGGYVRSAKLRFARTPRSAQRYDSYDYNVPLALPPYGYTPGFWGYGGRRYYDKFGNYTKYGQGDIPETRRGDSGLIETIPRSRLR